jgi:cyanate permease
LAGGIVGDTVSGLLTDGLLQRGGNLLIARRNLIGVSLAASLLFIVPVQMFRNLPALTPCLSAALFCLELTIGPIWAVPSDIAPKFSGTAAGIMNTGSAVAAFASPILFGWLVDLTGDWHLSFAGSVALLLLGIVVAFWIEPDRPVDGPSRSAIEATWLMRRQLALLLPQRNLIATPARAGERRR